MHAKDERRKNKRLNISLPIRIKKLYGDDYLEKDVLSKNLSANGIGFEGEVSLRPNARLLLEMKLPNIKEMIRVVSRVVWIKKLEQEKLYDFGSEFISIKDNDLQIMEDYINMISF